MTLAAALPDQTWRDGQWQPSAADAPSRPGAYAKPEARLHEGDEARFAPKVWCGVMAALALLCAPGPFLGEGIMAWLSGAAGLLFGALAYLAWRTSREAATRVIVWDEAGIADADFRGVKRIAWPAIAAFERINSALDRQREYDGLARSSSAVKPKGLRPRSIWVWTARAADGRTLLEMVEPMAPPEAFAALRARIEERTLPRQARSRGAR